MKTIHQSVKFNHQSLSTHHAYKAKHAAQNRFATLSSDETWLLSGEQPENDTDTSFSYPDSLSDSSSDESPSPKLARRKTAQIIPQGQSTLPRAKPIAPNNGPSVPPINLNLITRQYPELYQQKHKLYSESESDTSSSDGDYNDAEELYTIYA